MQNVSSSNMKTAQRFAHFQQMCKLCTNINPVISVSLLLYNIAEYIKHDRYEKQTSMTEIRQRTGRLSAKTQ